MTGPINLVNEEPFIVLMYKTGGIMKSKTGESASPIDDIASATILFNVDRNIATKYTAIPKVTQITYGMSSLA